MVSRCVLVDMFGSVFGFLRAGVVSFCFSEWVLWLPVWLNVL